MDAFTARLSSVAVEISQALSSTRDRLDEGRLSVLRDSIQGIAEVVEDGHMGYGKTRAWLRHPAFFPALMQLLHVSAERSYSALEKGIFNLLFAFRKALDDGSRRSSRRLMQMSLALIRSGILQTVSCQLARAAAAQQQNAGAQLDPAASSGDTLCTCISAAAVAFKCTMDWSRSEGGAVDPDDDSHVTELTSALTSSNIFENAARAAVLLARSAPSLPESAEPCVSALLSWVSWGLDRWAEAAPGSPAAASFRAALSGPSVGHLVAAAAVATLHAGDGGPVYGMQAPLTEILALMEAQASDDGGDSVEPLMRLDPVALTCLLHLLRRRVCPAGLRPLSLYVLLMRGAGLVVAAERAREGAGEEERLREGDGGGGEPPQPVAAAAAAGAHGESEGAAHVGRVESLPRPLLPPATVYSIAVPSLAACKALLMGPLGEWLPGGQGDGGEGSDAEDDSPPPDGGGHGAGGGSDGGRGDVDAPDGRASPDRTLSSGSGGGQGAADSQGGGGGGSASTGGPCAAEGDAEGGVAALGSGGGGADGICSDGGAGLGDPGAAEADAADGSTGAGAGGSPPLPPASWLGWWRAVVELLRFALDGTATDAQVEKVVELLKFYWDPKELLPDEPPASLSAALEAGLLQRLESLLRRGHNGQIKGRAASLMQLNMGHLFISAKLQDLLPYAPPREAASLLATVGKVLRWQLLRVRTAAAVAAKVAAAAQEAAALVAVATEVAPAAEAAAGAAAASRPSREGLGASHATALEARDGAAAAGGPAAAPGGQAAALAEEGAAGAGMPAAAAAALETEADAATIAFNFVDFAVDVLFNWPARHSPTSTFNQLCFLADPEPGSPAADPAARARLLQLCGFALHSLLPPLAEAVIAAAHNPGLLEKVSLGLMGAVNALPHYLCCLPLEPPRPQPAAGAAGAGAKGAMPVRASNPASATGGVCASTPRPGPHGSAGPASPSATATSPEAVRTGTSNAAADSTGVADAAVVCPQPASPQASAAAAPSSAMAAGPGPEPAGPSSWAAPAPHGGAWREFARVHMRAVPLLGAALYLVPRLFADKENIVHHVLEATETLDRRYEAFKGLGLACLHVARGFPEEVQAAVDASYAARSASGGRGAPGAAGSRSAALNSHAPANFMIDMKHLISKLPQWWEQMGGEASGEEEADMLKLRDDLMGLWYRLMQEAIVRMKAKAGEAYNPCPLPPGAMLPAASAMSPAVLAVRRLLAAECGPPPQPGEEQGEEEQRPPLLPACANPACVNMAGSSEAELPLPVACPGCGAARYCGARCREAHRRAGHGEECAGGGRRGA